MGEGFTGSGRSYETVPQRKDSPAMYAEGENPGEVLEFLSSLTKESELYLENYKMGMPTSPAGSPGTGEKIAENIQPEENEGYVLALYHPQEGEHPVQDAEIYAAFSEALPRGLGERIAGENPKIINGARITGDDEALNTEELWQEARKAGIRDSRPHVKFDRAIRPFLTVR